MNKNLVAMLAAIDVGETQPVNRAARKRLGLPIVNANTIASARKSGHVEMYFEGDHLMMTRIK